jgi:uncharacterized protein
MDCNFACPYCFEKKKKGIMNEITMERIVKFVKSFDMIKRVNLTWFGGEPLLAPNVIALLSQQIGKVNKYTYYSNIITNGYFFNAENRKILEDSNISHIQLSMDGIFDSHNRKRFTKTDKDTFSSIIYNIDNFHKSNSKLKIGIRINIGSDNIHEFNEIDHFFKNKYADDKRISIHYAFIVDTTKNENKTAIKNNNDKIAFLKRLALQTDNIHHIYPDNGISECAVRNNNAWVFDAKGDVYKCWEIIGNIDYKVGELIDEGIKITNKTMLNRYLYGADHLQDSKCLTCNALPICCCGCPQKRIENEFQNKKFDLSPYCDDNLDKYLIERIKIYENEKSY